EAAEAAQAERDTLAAEIADLARQREDITTYLNELRGVLATRTSAAPAALAVPERAYDAATYEDAAAEVATDAGAGAALAAAPVAEVAAAPDDAAAQVAASAADAQAAAPGAEVLDAEVVDAEAGDAAVTDADVAAAEDADFDEVDVDDGVVEQADEASAASAVDEPGPAPEDSSQAESEREPRTEVMDAISGETAVMPAVEDDRRCRRVPVGSPGDATGTPGGGPGHQSGTGASLSLT